MIKLGYVNSTTKENSSKMEQNDSDKDDELPFFQIFGAESNGSKEIYGTKEHDKKEKDTSVENEYRRLCRPFAGNFRMKSSRVEVNVNDEYSCDRCCAEITLSEFEKAWGEDGDPKERKVLRDDVNNHMHTQERGCALNGID